MTMPPDPGLPSDTVAPRFEAPWQARIFAAMVSLADAGCFRWEEFQQRLIAEVGRGDGDPGRYYEQWLAAAEKLLTEKGLEHYHDVMSRSARAKTRASRAKRA